MTKLPAIMLYPGDWLQDEVAGCSLAAQGLWLRMLFVMHTAAPYGYLSQNGKAMTPETAAQRVGCTRLGDYLSLLDELDAAGVPSRTAEGVIFSRRMVRDHKRREEAKRNGKRGGNPQLRNNGNPWVNPKDNPDLKYEDEVEEWVWWGDGAEGGEGVELPPELRTQEFRNAYAEFQTYRRERKEFLTGLAVKKQFTLLASFGSDGAVASIEQSIRNNWTGLFEVKEKRSGGSSRNGSPKTTADQRGHYPEPAGGLPEFGAKRAV